MILRVIRGRADDDRLAALRAALNDRLGGGPDAEFGPDRHHLGVRPGDGHDEVLLLACWRSAEAAAAGDARNVSPWRLASQHLEDVRIEHFEIDRNVLRDPGARPIALRVATGRFSRPGGDIRMQELLRERLSAVGPEMTEAYVGRRLLGRTVDVTFVSVWQARPAGQQLEDPFWPDISIQYDEFSVEVYGPVD
jgi:hypothetical protein